MAIENKNLTPSVIKKEKNFNFFTNVLNNYNKGKQLNQSKKIIEKLEKNKEYGTYSMPAFIQYASKEIQNGSKGTLFSLDINDLYLANKAAKDNRALVNKDIKSLIDDIVEIMPNAYIAKGGDEVIIFDTETIDKEDAEEKNNKIKNLKRGILTFSSGFTTDIDSGLENALKKADEEMYKNKGETKLAKMEAACGGSIDKLIEYIVAGKLDKCRTNVDSIKKRSKRTEFSNNYDAAMSGTDIDKIIEECNNTQNMADPIEEDKYQKRMEKYRNDFIRKYNNTNEQEIESYVLSKMLNEGNFEGTISNEYFQQFEKSKIEKMQDYELISVDVSGLKYVNDTFGHVEGDKQLQEFMNKFQSVLSENDIQTLSSIVVKGAGNCFVPIKKLSPEKKEQLMKSIHDITAGVDEEKKLYLQCDIIGKDSINKNIDKGKDGFDVLLSKVEKNLLDKSLNAKITSPEQIKRLIKEMYFSVYDNDIIKAAIKDGKISKDQIREKIDSTFKDIVKGNSSEPTKNEKQRAKEERNKQNANKDFEKGNNELKAEEKSQEDNIK